MTTTVKQPRIKFKWIVVGAIATGTGAYTLNLVLPDTRAEHDPQHYYSNIRIRFYTSLPWNALSRVTGYGATMTIPVFMRSTLYGAYVKAYNCNMEEAKDPNLESYRSFAEFFNRPLKERARPISASTMVSLNQLIVTLYV